MKYRNIYKKIAQDIFKNIVSIEEKEKIKVNPFAGIGLTALGLTAGVFLSQTAKNLADVVFSEVKKEKKQIEKYKEIKESKEFKDKIKEIMEHEDLLHIPEELRKKYIKHLTNSFANITLIKPELIIQGVKMMHNTDGILPQDYLSFLSKEEEKFIEK